MIPVKITAKNFLSFRELEYSFEGKPYLIQGENLTDDSQKSNGSGKSALKAIMEVCLYGKTSRNVKDIDLILWGESYSEVSLSINCPLRKETMRIVREFRLKDSSKLKLFVNDKSVTFSTVLSGNKEILDWMGIVKEDIQNYFIIDKYRYRPFFTSSNRENSELIGRFSNANIIKGIDKSIEETITEKLDPEWRNIELIISKGLGTKEAYEEELSKEINKDLKKERDELIDSLRISTEQSNSEIVEILSKIKTLNVSINEKENWLRDLLIEIKEADAKLKKMESDSESQSMTTKILKADSKVKEYENSKKDLQIKVYHFEKSKKELFEIISDVDKTLMGKISCPQCGFEFIPSEDSVISLIEQEQTKLETEQLLTSINDKISSMEKQEKEILKKLEVSNQKVTELRQTELNIYSILKKARRIVSDLESKKYTLESEVKKLNSDKDKYLIDIDARKDLIEGNEKRIEELLVKKLVNPRIKELKGKIQEIDVRLRNDKKRLTQKEIEIDEVKAWVNNFKKFNQFLAVKSLRIIQGYINKFLSELDSDLQVKLEGYICGNFSYSEYGEQYS